MNNKTHYRKVFKSDHLGVADLEEFQEEGKTSIYTISYVKQEINVSVAGRKGNHNIAYFKEGIKPLVLNSTNSKVLRKITNSPFLEDWKDITIEIFVDSSVRMKGEVVGGLRIKKYVPKEKESLNEKHPKWASCLKVIKDKEYTIEDLEKKYKISEDVKKKLTAIQD